MTELQISLRNNYLISNRVLMISILLNVVFISTVGYNDVIIIS